MSKALWKQYRDDCISTLRTIAEFMEEQKYDYDQKDLDRLLRKVKEHHEIYLDKKYQRKPDKPSKNNPIDFYS